MNSNSNNNNNNTSTPTAQSNRLFGEDLRARVFSRKAQNNNPFVCKAEIANTISFGLVSLIDSAKVNSFRSLDSDTTLFLKTIALNNRYPNVRFFVVESMAGLMVTQLNRSHSGCDKLARSFSGIEDLLRTDPVDDDSSNEFPIPTPMTQEELFEPLLDVIGKTVFPDLREFGLKTLESILESCGQLIDDASAWALILNAVSGNSSSNVAFKILQLVVDDFLETLGPSNIKILLACAVNFGSSR